MTPHKLLKLDSTFLRNHAAAIPDREFAVKGHLFTIAARLDILADMFLLLGKHGSQEKEFGKILSALRENLSAIYTSTEDGTRELPESSQS